MPMLRTRSALYEMHESKTQTLGRETHQRHVVSLYTLVRKGVHISPG